jgi:hypothetical protein
MSNKFTGCAKNASGRYVCSKLDQPVHSFCTVFAFFATNGLMRDFVLSKYENINLESVLREKT